jgi:hypothetical protein
LIEITRHSQGGQIEQRIFRSASRPTDYDEWQTVEAATVS